MLADDLYTVQIVLSGGTREVRLPYSETERLRSLYEAWMAEPETEAFYTYADEHRHYYLRLSAIQYMEITSRKRPARVIG